MRSWLAVAVLAACGAVWGGCSDANDNNSGGGTSTAGASTTDDLGSTPNADQGSGNSAPGGPVQ